MLADCTLWLPAGFKAQRGSLDSKTLITCLATINYLVPIGSFVRGLFNRTLSCASIALRS